MSTVTACSPSIAPDSQRSFPPANVHYHIRQGDPFENILDASEDFLTDLIVLATHGRTGIKRLVIGNVAEKVVRHARCPVLTVKPRSMHGLEEAAV